MSVSTLDRYCVSDGSAALRLAGLPFRVDHVDGWAVDAFHTRSGAEHAARLLNAGLARVDSHALIGCRVVAR